MVNEDFAVLLFHHFNWYLEYMTVVPIVGVVAIAFVIPEHVIIFHALNFLVEVAVNEIGFAAGLELFATACIAVDASSSIGIAASEGGLVLGSWFSPVSLEGWAFLFGFCLGEFVGVLYHSATLLGGFFVICIACPVNPAEAFLFAWPHWFQRLAKG